MNTVLLLYIIVSSLRYNGLFWPSRAGIQSAASALSADETVTWRLSSSTATWMTLPLS